MKFFRYVRHETVGLHDFGAYQIYVATMVGPRSRIYPGIVALHRGRLALEVPFPMPLDRATAFTDFFRAVVSGCLPNRHPVKGGLANYFQNLTLSVKGRCSEASGAAYRGAITFGNMLGARISAMAIEEHSLRDCVVADDTLYRRAHD